MDNKSCVRSVNFLKFSICELTRDRLNRWLTLVKPSEKSKTSYIDPYSQDPNTTSWGIILKKIFFRVIVEVDINGYEDDQIIEPIFEIDIVPKLTKCLKDLELWDDDYFGDFYGILKTQCDIYKNVFSFTFLIQNKQYKSKELSYDINSNDSLFRGYHEIYEGKILNAALSGDIHKKYMIKFNIPEFTDQFGMLKQLRADFYNHNIKQINEVEELAEVPFKIFIELDWDPRGNYFFIKFKILDIRRLK